MPCRRCPRVPILFAHNDLRSSESNYALLRYLKFAHLKKLGEIPSGIGHCFCKQRFTTSAASRPQGKPRTFRASLPQQV